MSREPVVGGDVVGSRHIQRPICNNWHFDSQKRLSTGDGDLDRERLQWHERAPVCKTDRESERARRAAERARSARSWGDTADSSRASSKREARVLTLTLYK